MVAGYSGEPYKLLPDPGPATLPGQPAAGPAGGHRAAVPSRWAVTPRGHRAGTVQAAPRVLLALATRPRDERPPHRPWGPRSCGGAPPSPPRALQQDYGEPGAEPKADQSLANFPSRPAYPTRRCGTALSRFSGARRGQPGARGQPEGARCLPSREPRPQSRARRWQGTARGHHSCSCGLLGPCCSCSSPSPGDTPAGLGTVPVPAGPVHGCPPPRVMPVGSTPSFAMGRGGREVLSACLSPALPAP